MDLNVLYDLFLDSIESDRWLENPTVLPDEWRYSGKKNFKNNQARLISDYIAGMTDRYALLEYDRLFDFKAKL